MQLRVEVQSHDMPAITCFTEEWKFKEGTIVEEPHCGRAPVHGLPDPLEEAAEASKGFANVHMNVLALSSSVSPHRRGRNGFGSKAYACHRGKPNPARNNGILAIAS
jgi:hypothetical protein